MYLKELKSYSDKVSKLRTAMIGEIETFFRNNPDEHIIIEETQGSNVNVRGDKEIDVITASGANGDEQDFDYDELDLCDLDMIIDIINDHIIAWNKTVDRCKNENY